MKCRKVFDLLSPYLDRELDQRKTEMVSQHLDECEHCRAQLAEMKSISDSIRDFAPINPPPRFEDVVLAKARCQQPPARSFLQAFLSGPGYKFAFGLSASVTILLAIAILFNLLPLIQHNSPHSAGKNEQIADQSTDPSINKQYLADSANQNPQQQYGNNWIQFVDLNDTNGPSFRVRPFVIDHQLVEAEDLLRILDAHYQQRIVCQSCKKRLDQLKFSPRYSLSDTQSVKDDQFNDYIIYTNWIE